MLRVLTVLTVLGVSMAQTPAPQARDGVITGQVVDAVSGRPVGAAIVSISGAGRAPPAAAVDGLGSRSGAPRILTGSDGRFVFRDLPAGQFHGRWHQRRLFRGSVGPPRHWRSLPAGRADRGAADRGDLGPDVEERRDHRNNCR